MVAIAASKAAAAFERVVGGPIGPIGPDGPDRSILMRGLQQASVQLTCFGSQKGTAPPSASFDSSDTRLVGALFSIHYWLQAILN